jgi:uncharacterized membrane protein YgaE (UPF0421/DUF939 family)
MGWLKSRLGENSTKTALAGALTASAGYLTGTLDLHGLVAAAMMALVALITHNNGTAS